MAWPWVPREQLNVPWNRKGRISEAAVGGGPGMGPLWQLKGGIEEEDVLAGRGGGWYVEWPGLAHSMNCA